MNVDEKIDKLTQELAELKQEIKEEKEWRSIELRATYSAAFTLEDEKKELIYCLRAAKRAIDEAISQLEFSVGAEVLANVNGYEGSPNIEEVLKKYADL